MQTSTVNEQVRTGRQPDEKRGSITKEIKTAFYKDAIAGACAGTFAKTVVAPIERVKIIMQLQNSINSSSIKNVEQYKNASAWNVTKKVYREQGVLAFWRGNTANVMRQGGNAALNFMLMDWYKSAVTPILNLSLSLPSNRTEKLRRKRRAVLSSFLSGGLAGGTATTFLYPFEFLRTRLAMDIGHNEVTRQYPNGMRDVFCSTIKLDGVRGLYQGYGIAVGGVILYRALHLGGYDAIKTELAHRNFENITWTQRFIIAQIVSLTAGTICYPIDSVRRRLMMQAGISPELRKYKNSIDCFIKVYSIEGIRGFYLGIAPNLLRSVGGALLLVAYDAIKGII